MSDPQRLHEAFDAVNGARARLAQVSEDLAAARRWLERAASALEIELSPEPEPDPGSEPEPEPEPPVVVLPPPVVQSGDPDFSEFPFASRMPAWRRYVRPTEAGCDWIITDRFARSLRGLGDLAPDEKGNVAGLCYRKSLAAGHGPRVILGVKGDGGRIYGGGLWDPNEGHSLSAVASGGGFVDVDVEVVGLTDDARAEIGWGRSWGKTARLAVFDLGLLGASDQFGIRAMAHGGEIILDGCWALSGLASGTYQSFIHCTNIERMVIRGMKWRGLRSVDPGIRVSEHLFYPKKMLGDLFVIESDLRGGNRTGMQVRPGRDDASPEVQPNGDIVLADNVSDKAAWEHDTLPGAEDEDGGAFLSVSSNPNGRTFILRNRITDARYQCAQVNGQSPARNWLNPRGFPVGEVYVDGNVFDNARASRAAMAFTACERLYIGSRNVVAGHAAVLNDHWGAAFHGIKNGRTFLVGPPAKHPRYLTNNAALNREVEMTDADLAPLRFASWGDAFAAEATTL